jgi:hypothetical protein
MKRCAAKDGARRERDSEYQIQEDNHQERERDVQIKIPDTEMSQKSRRASLNGRVQDSLHKER